MRFASKMVFVALQIVHTVLPARSRGHHPSLRVYRFWRDLGYAIGALLSGVIADALSVGAAIHVVAAIRFASRLVSLAMMRAQRPRG